ncbi:MAG: gephyrin-like molybdotransferase Glp [Gemmataceae bacterium]
MVPVEEALEIVLRHARPLPAASCPLSPAVLGRVLAEDVASDLDMPPFDKALMDGYAARCADLRNGEADLPVQAEVTAGQTAPALRPGEAIRIMTGAPIPAGADAVVQIEHTRGGPDGRVEIRTKQPQPGQNILARAREMKRGELVLQAGSILGPQHLGLLATVGRTSARVISVPTAALLATGDELVDAIEFPGPAGLRNSNGPMLAAQTVRAGATPLSLGIARDQVDVLRAMIQTGLQASVLVLSGGVSAGKRDLVPRVLQELGVEPHFHKVAMKPGKPLFFGTRGDTLVFGLPGNPVASFCTFELFVRPAIRRLAGCAEPGPKWMTASLLEDLTYATDRPTYHPAVLTNADGVNRVRAVPWFGSPDLRALSQANALLLILAESQTQPAEWMMPVLPLN